MALAIAVSGIGTSKFATLGLPPNLSDGFHLSIPTVGALVSGYALSGTIGAPLPHSKRGAAVNRPATPLPTPGKPTATGRSHPR